MVHGYHVIIPMDGFWLPNDPRGSLSETVRRWEFARFGSATKSLERRSLDELTPDEIDQRNAARQSLRFPPVSLNPIQIQAIAEGFAEQVAKSNYTVWACSILPEHTHLVIARHTYKVEQVVNLLKGTATKKCLDTGCHPLQKFALPGERPPRMWVEHEWKVFLDSEAAIEAAIRYVEENPLKESLPAQSWPFVTPFAGLDPGWIAYH